MNLDQFYKSSESLASAFDDFAKKHGLAQMSVLDHICYKCGSRESFEALRAILEPESDFVYQSYISKRRIAIIKLRKGIETSMGTVSLLELSDQKPDGSQKDGWDHIEVVPKGVSYADFAKKLADQGAALRKVERPHHTTFDIDIGNGFEIKLSTGPLLDKIKREEMK